MRDVSKARLGKVSNQTLKVYEFFRLKEWRMWDSDPGSHGFQTSTPQSYVVVRAHQTIIQRTPQRGYDSTIKP